MNNSMNNDLYTTKLYYNFYSNPSLQFSKYCPKCGKIHVGKCKKVKKAG